MSSTLAVLALVALLDPASEAASPQPGGIGTSVAVEGVEVVGRGGAAPLAPEVEFGAEEIDGFGADDIANVISRMGETIGSDGEPFLLVNGRRVPNPGLFGGFPPDALMRVEVLPREAGALYGAKPGRRVVNIVLQRRFASRDGRLESAKATEGGTAVSGLDVRRASIAGERSSQAGLKVSRQTSLRAGERGFVAEEMGGEAVTLRPALDAVAANLLVTRMIGEWSGTIGANGVFQETRSVSGQAHQTRLRTGSFAATAGASGEVQGWALQLGLTGRWLEARQSGVLRSSATNRAVSARFDANRSILDLPAGPLVVNLTGEAARFQSISDFEPNDAWSASDELGGAISMPLARRAMPESGGVEMIGDVSATLGLNYRGGGAGGGEGVNAALSWAPVDKLRFSGNWSSATEGLSSDQRSAPKIYGAPIVVYDFQTGSANEVTPIRGGNPELRTPTHEQLLVSVSAGPFTSRQMIWSASYARSESIGSLAVLPMLAPQVEKAFPDRFERDGQGRLAYIDQRPFNADLVVAEKLSTNFALRTPLPVRDAGGGFLRLAINHVWQFSNVIELGRGLPPMSRIEGDGGGMPRQELSVLVDGRWDAWGLNAALRWRDAYRVRREIGIDGADDLSVAALGAVDVKLVYRAEPVVGPTSDSRRGSGLQVELGVDNLFDARPRARLGDGRLAPSYVREMQEPVGRIVRIALKGRF